MMQNIYFLACPTLPVPHNPSYLIVLQFLLVAGCPYDTQTHHCTVFDILLLTSALFILNSNYVLMY